MIFFPQVITINLCYSMTAPLIAEYDRHMDEMNEQLQRYQVKHTLKIGFTNSVMTLIGKDASTYKN